jgi:hypothetical protein
VIDNFPHLHYVPGEGFDLFGKEAAFLRFK